MSGRLSGSIWQQFCDLMMRFIRASVNVHGDTVHQDVLRKVQDLVKLYDLETHPVLPIRHTFQQKQQVTMFGFQLSDVRPLHLPQIKVSFPL